MQLTARACRAPGSAAAAILCGLQAAQLHSVATCPGCGTVCVQPAGCKHTQQQPNQAAALCCAAKNMCCPHMHMYATVRPPAAVSCCVCGQAAQGSSLPRRQSTHMQPAGRPLPAGARFGAWVSCCRVLCSCSFPRSARLLRLWLWCARAAAFMRPLHHAGQAAALCCAAYALDVLCFWHCKLGSYNQLLGYSAQGSLSPVHCCCACHQLGTSCLRAQCARPWTAAALCC